MKAKGKQKEFDAVKSMREIRDQMSRKIMNMTFSEEKAFLRKLSADQKNAANGKAPKAETTDAHR